VSAERYERLSRIFTRANALSGNEREAYVVNECGGDAALLREVRELLGLDEGAEPVLDGELVSADVLPRNLVM
jgi:hypothetical protein